MASDFYDEFRPVDDIIASKHRSCGIDAFTLTYLRAERQVRKLFTNLAYQSNAFGARDCRDLRRALHDAPPWSYKKLSDGIRRLSGETIEGMVGQHYARLSAVLEQARVHRQKLFHGQLPDRYLSGADLLRLEADIREWCRLLADGAERQVGYNGFGQDSFHKTRRKEIVDRVSKELPDLAAYEALLRRLK